MPGDQSQATASRRQRGERTLLCPRCAYDQRGVYNALPDPRPDTSTCSECGLLFEWADVLDPDRSNLKGFVEHSTGWWVTCKAAIGTTLLALRPWAFWSRVRMEHRVVPRRWFVWIAWIALVPSLVVLGLVVLAFISFAISSPGTTNWTQWLLLFTETCRDLIVTRRSYGGAVHLGLLVSASCAAASIGMGMVPLAAATTLGRLKVRTPLIGRAIVFSLAPAIAWFVARLIGATAPIVEMIVRTSYFTRRSLLEFLVGFRGVNPEVLDQIAVYVVFLSILWCSVWWVFTMRGGWRIKEAGTIAQIAAAQLVVATLCVAITLLYIA